ncbi:hypothetical protein CANCADRAFT_30004 [Tortispora caseinolytica NRRL Y-17796]|uniref:Uncharacterized protein n=1 Tax=Tortispora caseinolytica NRRL Y-17796 TaxID=767744 RepID=A0A1E4TIY7_9ASCO|nr:hypothetical protein CANCADRAFT_30004 [Tortispora caseinolytica NRRL Y-17796]
MYKDRWTSDIMPVVNMAISRWIFVGCICFSFVLIGYELYRAYKVIRSDDISRAYTDPWAQSYYTCIKGYNYFCVFGAITKSKRFIDCTALLTYFSLKGWIRTVFADGPRQAINAITLFQVLHVTTTFIETLREIALTTPINVVLISFMAFSLGVWAISALQIIAGLLVGVPLSCHIRGSLSKFCYAKIDKRISKIVRKHHLKTVEEIIRENNRLGLDSDDFLFDTASRHSADQQAFWFDKQDINYSRPIRQLPAHNPATYPIAYVKTSTDSTRSCSLDSKSDITCSSYPYAIHGLNIPRKPPPSYSSQTNLESSTPFAMRSLDQKQQIMQLLAADPHRIDRIAYRLGQHSSSFSESETHNITSESTRVPQITRK